MLKPMLANRNVPQDGISATRLKMRSVTVNLAESPLGWLKAHGKISERQFVAGEQLRRDYEASALGAKVTMHWDAAPSNGGRRSAAAPGASTYYQIDAKRRFDAAIAAAGLACQIFSGAWSARRSGAGGRENAGLAHTLWSTGADLGAR